MKPAVLAWSALALGAVAVAAIAVEGNTSDPGTQPVAARDTPPPRLPRSTAATPMAGRVATLGILNKRNGLSRDLVLKPGQGVRINDVIVKLRACDQTEPWEKDQLTGAFVQVIVLGTDAKWRRIFSGWLFKETPSLNVVEHPVYDVWVKACTMRHPDVGPDTVVVDSAAPAGAPAPSRSNAPKSPQPEGDSVSAESSNST